MRTIFAWTLAAATAAMLAVPTSSRAAADGELATQTGEELLPRIDFWRKRTWYWQHVIGQPRWPTRYLERTTPNLTYRQWVLDLWLGRAARAKNRALQPPNRDRWLCIFRYERNPDQGWHTYTGNGFYGGLQLNLTFQRHYGRWLLQKKGLAHRWTAIEQIWVAERGRRVQGWYAWPNAASACGLI